MFNYRGWIKLGMGFAVLLCCSCMLFEQGLQNPGETDEELEGFEETLQAVIESELEQTTAPEEQAAPEERAAPELLAGWKQVEGSGGFYRLAVPDDWAQSGGDDHQEWCAADPSQGCLSVDLRIKYASAKSLLDDYLGGLQENVTGYQELSRSPVSLDGIDGLRADVSYTWHEKEERSFVIGLVYNRIGLVLSGFAAPQTFEQRSADFERALNSFTWVDFVDAPPYDRWGKYEAEHVIFTFPTGSWIDDSIDEIALDHERAYKAVVERLEVAANPPRVFMFLYPSETALYHSTARQSGFAITGLNEVHAIWSAPDDHQSLGHEMTHVISAHTIGEPQEALLGEGLAVCLDQSGRDYRQVGQELVESQTWVSFANLAGDAWFEQDLSVAYQQSGSAACYLLERYGAEKFKAIYPQEIDDGLRMLGITLEQLQEDWLGWVKGS